MSLALSPRVALEPELTPGTILRRAFSVWGGNLPAFFVVSLAAYSPVILLWLSPFVGVPLGPLYENEALLNVVSALVALLVGQVAAGAVACGAVEALRGNPVSIGRTLSVALRRAPRILSVSVVAFLATVLGFVLLVVPGVILSAALVVAAPVAAAEQTGVAASLRRSWGLTRGYRRTIFAASFVIGAVTRGGDKVLEAMIPALDAVSPWATFGVTQLGVALLVSLPAVMASVVYHDLRVLKEGTETSQLAAVFE